MRENQKDLYAKPMLERFGTFRELTRAGAAATRDAVLATCEVVVTRS